MIPIGIVGVFVYLKYSIITPAFSIGKIRNMLPRFYQTVKTLGDNIEELITNSSGHEAIVDMKTNIKRIHNGHNLADCLWSRTRFTQRS